MDNVIWKSFKLGDLFEFNSSNQLPFTKKELNISPIQTDEYNIAVVTQSEKNNGITGYINRQAIDSSKIMNNSMIFSLNFGTCFYQHNEYCLLDTHGSIFRLVAEHITLRQILEKDVLVGNFFAKIIMTVCKNGIYNYNWKPNSQRASREIILLPCLEVEKGQEYIWEENGKHYTLAVEYVAYLYLTGRVEYNQRLVDNYTYQY